jgi:hypothetical protein
MLLNRAAPLLYNKWTADKDDSFIKLYAFYAAMADKGAGHTVSYGVPAADW